jgi:hypothetical protein
MLQQRSESPSLTYMYIVYNVQYTYCTVTFVAKVVVRATVHEHLRMLCFLRCKCIPRVVSCMPSCKDIVHVYVISGNSRRHFHGAHVNKKAFPKRNKCPVLCAFRDANGMNQLHLCFRSTSVQHVLTQSHCTLYRSFIHHRQASAGCGTFCLTVPVLAVA